VKPAGTEMAGQPVNVAYQHDRIPSMQLVIDVS
jgi:hypothetical protein